MKTYKVTVDIRQSHTYEVKANSEEEAREKMDDALLIDPKKPVTWDTEEPISGVSYGDNEVWEQETWHHVQELEEGE